VNKQDFNAGLLKFLDSSPSPFHATAKMAERFVVAGFELLDESDDWNIESGKSYVVTRNDSSIIAFRTGNTSATQQGWRMIGAHTDSPCLKVKPQPDINSKGICQLAVEVYGGALLAPWFDRDLSLAGRVTFEMQAGGESRLESRLVNFPSAIATIPSLAIHLDRTANESRTINRQKEMNLVLGTGAKPFKQLLSDQLQDQYGDLGEIKVLDWEIYTYDLQPAAMIGLNQEYIVSARLDNLLSCYIGMEALLAADSSQPSLLVCSDHEEVGSQSQCGAQGPFLRDVLERVYLADSAVKGKGSHVAQTLSRSMMISADNAHGIHPNYVDKHEGNHGPELNAGPAIKINASQRYATNSESAATFRMLAGQVDVPVQAFVSRNDMACGSTIGPITSGELGVCSLDIGCPQWGMHSVRETAGADDGLSLFKVLEHFYNYKKPLNF
jgi:aspartyl aminopeptidase